MLLMAGMPVPIRLEYQGTFYDGTTASSYTFADVPIGEAASNRLIIIGFLGQAVTASPTSATYYGIDYMSVANATNVDWFTYNYEWGFATTHSAELWGAIVPTGTTTDITIDMVASTAFAEIAVWTAYDAGWPYDTGQVDYVTPTSSTSGTFRLFEGGCAFHVGRPGLTYTGLTEAIVGTEMTGGYLKETDAAAAHAFTISAAQDLDLIGGLSIGP